MLVFLFHHKAHLELVDQEVQVEVEQQELLHQMEMQGQQILVVGVELVLVVEDLLLHLLDLVERVVQEF